MNISRMYRVKLNFTFLSWVTLSADTAIAASVVVGARPATGANL